MPSGLGIGNCAVKHWRPKTEEHVIREANQTRKTAGNAARENLRATLPALRAAGITQVTAEYDGQGDSGQIDQITTTSSSCGPVSPQPRPGVSSRP